MSRIINTLADLYELFNADDFVSLNQRIFKDTECGASISIYGTLPPADAPTASRDRALAEATQTALQAEYDRLLPQLTEAHAQADDDGKQRIAEANYAFCCGNPGALVAWAREVVPGAFPPVPPPERVSVAYHNGDGGPVPPTFEFTGFSIHSIVEGSDATVDSDVFPLGTTKAQVDEWIEDMEEEVTRLWDEANREEEVPEPDEDDLFWTYKGDVMAGSKVLGHTQEHDEAMAIMAQWATKENYWPNAWVHGGDGSTWEPFKYGPD